LQNNTLAVRAALCTGAVRAAQEFIGQVWYGWVISMIDSVANFPDFFEFCAGCVPCRRAKSQYRAFRKKKSD
jgi:hypothetical protein